MYSLPIVYRKQLLSSFKKENQDKIGLGRLIKYCFSYVNLSLEGVFDLKVIKIVLFQKLGNILN